MELTCEKSKAIEDGKHDGLIVGVDYREKPYPYTDIVIEFEEGKRIKYGVPTALQPDSKLGKLLEWFGVQVTVGMNYDVAKCLTGKKCTFVTLKEGQYANVVKDSLRPR